MIMARQRRRLRRRPVPPHDARLLQGAAVHGRRLGHRRDGRRAEPRPDGRLPQGDAVHVRLLRHRRPRARRASRRSRASSPRTRSSLVVGDARRLALGALRRRLRRRVPHRGLHVADDLPRLLRRAGARGARARGRATCTTPSVHAQPGDRRGRGHRRRLPRPRAPHRRARAADEGRDGRRSRVLRDRRRLRCRSRRSTHVARPRSSSRRSPSSRTTSAHPSDGLHRRSACCSAPSLGLAGIALAYRIWVQQPGHRRRGCASALRAAAPAVRQQVVLRRAHRPARRAAVRAGSGASASRPSSASSSTARSSAARPALVRAGSAAVRALQSGFLRAYAALLVARRRRPSPSTSSSRS